MAMKSASFTPVRASEEDKKEEVIEKVNEELDTEIKEAEKVEEEVIEKEEKRELLKDINLDDFFFTGEIFYTFKMGPRTSVKMKTLTSQELQETQAYLWEMRKSDMSAAEAQMKYSVAVLARAMVKYNDKVDLASKKLEERIEFINALPSVAIPILYDDYTLLELSAAEMLKNGGMELKN